MVNKDAVEEITDGSPGFYTHIFLMPKKSGGYRPVINLKPLNAFLVTEKFKMETPRAIRKAITKGEFASSIDYTDAYFHLAVYKKHRKYLRFVVRGRIFQFKAMPFGLSTAPSEFTRMAATVATVIHRESMNLHQYLDDWLMRALSRVLCIQHTQRVVNLSTSLGLLINEKKSELTPTQRFTFLGECYDLVEGIVRPSEAAFQKILILHRIFKRTPYQTARALLRLLGILSSIADIVPLGRLHMRPLQLYLLARWTLHTKDITYIVELNDVFFSNSADGRNQYGRNGPYTRTHSAAFA